MKGVTISKVNFPVTCDFYQCMHLSTYSFATADSPPGHCFRVCNEHLEGLKHVLGLQGVSEIKAVVEDAQTIGEQAVALKKEVDSIKKKGKESKTNAFG